MRRMMLVVLLCLFFSSMFLWGVSAFCDVGVTRLGRLDWNVYLNGGDLISYTQVVKQSPSHWYFNVQPSVAAPLAATPFVFASPLASTPFAACPFVAPLAGFGAQLGPLSSPSSVRSSSPNSEKNASQLGSTALRSCRKRAYRSAT